MLEFKTRKKAIQFFIYSLTMAFLNWFFFFFKCWQFREDNLVYSRAQNWVELKWFDCAECGEGVCWRYGQNVKILFAFHVFVCWPSLPHTQWVMNRWQVVMRIWKEKMQNQFLYGQDSRLLLTIVTSCYTSQITGNEGNCVSLQASSVLSLSLASTGKHTMGSWPCFYASQL